MVYDTCSNNPLTTEGDDVYTTTFKICSWEHHDRRQEILDFVWGSRRADEMNIEGQVGQKAEDEYLEDMMSAPSDADGLPSNTIDVDATDVTTSPSGGRPELPQGDPNVPQGTWRASKNSPTAGPNKVIQSYCRTWCPMGASVRWWWTQWHGYGG